MKHGFEEDSRIGTLTSKYAPASTSSSLTSSGSWLARANVRKREAVYTTQVVVDNRNVPFEQHIQILDFVASQRVAE